MSIFSKKTLVAAVGALTLGAGIAATSSPAAAWGIHHHHHRGWGPGLGIGLGLAVGGALAASSYRGPAYYDCYFERRPVYNRFGHLVGYKRIRVC